MLEKRLKGTEKDIEIMADCNCIYFSPKTEKGYAILETLVDENILNLDRDDYGN